MEVLCCVAESLNTLVLKVYHIGVFALQLTATRAKSNKSGLAGAQGSAVTERETGERDRVVIASKTLAYTRDTHAHTAAHSHSHSHSHGKY